MRLLDRKKGLAVMLLTRHKSQVDENSNVIHLHPREREQRALFRVYLFGPFRLLHNKQSLGEPVWRRNKAKSLLKWFMLHPGELCSADQLIDLFWPDISPEAAYGNLHVTIHYLRHLLEPEAPRGQDSTYIRRHANNFYQFVTNDNWWADVFEVQDLFETARKLDKAGDEAKAAFYYRKIVGYCEQGFLPEDLYEECFQPYRRHHECLYLQALLRLIEIYQQRNECHEVLEYAYQALHLDPYYEPAIKAVVGVHIEQGNLSGAVRTLDEFQRFLKEELGIEPGRDIQALRKKIQIGMSTSHPRSFESYKRASA